MPGLLTVVRREPRAEVLVVTNMWPLPGRPTYGIFVKRQVDSLVREGLACDVLFVRGHESILAYIRAAVQLAFWSLRPRRPYRLVHAHGGETGVVARAYFRAPLVISYCGSDLLGVPDEEGRVSRGWRLRCWVVRVLSILSRATITKTRELEGVLPPRVRGRNAVIPNGVDRDLFLPQDRDVARSQLRWARDEHVVLFAADPALPFKRYRLAAEACRLAEQTVGAIRLVTAKGVPPSTMPTLMSAASCLLHTSRREGSPNVVKEALACDLPVVATAVGDMVELLDGASPSYVCKATPEALARALVAVLDPPRRSNGREASAWLEQHAVARRVLAHYERAWSSGPGPTTTPAESASLDRPPVAGGHR